MQTPVSDELWSIAFSQLATIARTASMPGSVYPSADLYSYCFMVAASGLISYGIDNVDLFRRAPAYIDRILKDANLPICRSSFRRSSNLDVRATLLSRADEVIERDAFGAMHKSFVAPLRHADRIGKCLLLGWWTGSESAHGQNAAIDPNRLGRRSGNKALLQKRLDHRTLAASQPRFLLKCS